MAENGINEMRDVLKEGILALREMRKGIEHACAELRTLYGQSVRSEKGQVGSRGKTGRMSKPVVKTAVHSADSTGKYTSPF